MADCEPPSNATQQTSPFTQFAALVHERATPLQLPFGVQEPTPLALWMQQSCVVRLQLVDPQVIAAEAGAGPALGGVLTVPLVPPMPVEPLPAPPETPPEPPPAAPPPFPAVVPVLLAEKSSSAVLPPHATTEATSSATMETGSDRIISTS